MFSRRRSLFDFSQGRLTKAPRRSKHRSSKKCELTGGYFTRLNVETLEDRRMLALLLGPADDIDAINDSAPPGGQALGAEPTVVIDNFTVSDADTQDVFEYRAHSTGKLLVSSVTTAGNVDLMIDIQDSTGTSLIGGPIANGVDRTIPVVESQFYYILAMDTVVNGTGSTYSLDISNTAAPTPASVSLSPASDTGASNSDGVTSDNTPTFFIQDDIATFLPALPSGTNLGAIDSNGANGYDVQLVATNLATGTQTTANATRLGASATWTATTAALADGQYLVSARTVVVDATSGGAGGANTGFSQLSVPIFVTIDAVADPVVSTIMLSPDSDSGMLNTDNVTNLTRPSFFGVGPQNQTVRVFAQLLTAGGAPAGNPLQVGISTVGSDNTDSVPNDGQGAWELAIDPLVDGRYSITAQFEAPGGLLSPLITLATNLFVDTAAPNTPFLDLTTDTGRSNVDDITITNRPTFVMRSNATVNGGPTNAFSNDVKYRLYVRPAGNIGAPETLIYDSFTDPAIADFTTLASLTRTVSLTLNNPLGSVIPNGKHDFLLEIEDRAGNVSQDFLLPVTIDNVAPPISFGLVNTTNATDGLFDGSDTGTPNNGASFSDRITSDSAPTMWGRAEADAIVSLWLDANGDGIIQSTGAARDIFLGQTVANPVDGNLAFPAGYWQISSAIDLNDLTTINATGGTFARDGVRPLLVTAQDQAGNPVPVGAAGTINAAGAPAGTTVDALTIFLDTQGPQVDAVKVSAFPGYDLFDPKPSVNGPSPLINSLDIDLVDLPNRAAGFLANAIDNATAAPGVFQLVGDHVGTIAINTITFTPTAPAANSPAAITSTTLSSPASSHRWRN